MFMETIKVDTAPLMKEETCEAVNWLKNGKTLDMDQICSDVFSIDINTTKKIMYSLLKVIWMEEEVQNEWKDEMIKNCLRRGLEVM